MRIIEVDDKIMIQCDRSEGWDLALLLGDLSPAIPEKARTEGMVFRLTTARLARLLSHVCVEGTYPFEGAEVVQLG